MFIKKFNKNFYFNKYKKEILTFNYNRVYHISKCSTTPKRIIFFVKWNKDFTYCEYIEKKPLI